MDELTVLENVELPALLAGRSPRAARRRAAELLEQVGLTRRTAHLPTALSGGQRQRVAIARALANNPVIVFADEPTGNLDSVATTELLRLFDALHASGLTLVIVTHDERVAATADRLIAMRDGAFMGDPGTRRRHHRQSLQASWTGRLSGMGRLLLIWRLAARDLRRRPAQAGLLLAVIAAAMTALTLGLVLHGVTTKPYTQTQAQTAGPDVVASSVGYGGDSATFAALARAPGVVARSGPYPVAWPVLQAHGVSADVMAEGRDQAPAAVDQPEVFQGPGCAPAAPSWSAPSPTRSASASATP